LSQAGSRAILWLSTDRSPTAQTFSGSTCRSRQPRPLQPEALAFGQAPVLEQVPVLGQVLTQASGRRGDAGPKKCRPSKMAAHSNAPHPPVTIRTQKRDGLA